MTSLLDVNVLIALAWPNHVHHEAARVWFTGRRREGWATCLLTEAGFVRVSCNPSVVRHSVTPTDAILHLRRLRRLELHAFWSLDRSLLELPEGVLARIQGYRQITDALLLAAAMQRGGVLATFDSGIASLVANRERRFVCVIPV